MRNRKLVAILALLTVTSCQAPLDDTELFEVKCQEKVEGEELEDACQPGFLAIHIRVFDPISDQKPSCEGPNPRNIALTIDRPSDEGEKFERETRLACIDDIGSYFVNTKSCNQVKGISHEWSDTDPAEECIHGTKFMTGVVAAFSTQGAAIKDADLPTSTEPNDYAIENSPQTVEIIISNSIDTKLCTGEEAKGTDCSAQIAPTFAVRVSEESGETYSFSAKANLGAKNMMTGFVPGGELAVKIIPWVDEKTESSYGFSGKATVDLEGSMTSFIIAPSASLQLADYGGGSNARLNADFSIVQAGKDPFDPNGKMPPLGVSATVGVKWVLK